MFRKQIKGFLGLSSALLLMFTAVPETSPVPKSAYNGISIVHAEDLGDIDNSGTSGNRSIVDKEEVDSFSNQMQTLLDQTKIRDSDLAAASKVATPMVKGMRIVIAFLEFILFALVSFSTVIDIICLLYRPLQESILSKNAGGVPGGMSGGMMGGMMMGGMQGGGGAPASESGFDSFLKKISMHCSRTCVQVIQECCSSSASSQAGGMGMGMGMGAPAAPPPTKNLWLTYLKRKPVELICIGLCAVLFLGTAFTNFGILLATKLLEALSGLSL